ncbi:phage tail protein [Clostridioides difficile]
MSWAEVYKINSDIQGEPLNFLNYLQDLKLNGSESYLLYEGNHRIWEELYLNSLYLFSDRGIREAVYTAFSETDIDNLFDKGTKLGEQLNAFYRTDIFSLGNADNVVKGMTVEHYNSLEEKFKAGYDRYVTREQEKSTIGAWFNSTFSLDNTDLENLTTIEEILANVEATNAILNNSNAIVALTMCKTSMDAVVASSNAMDLLGQYILKVTAEPAVIKVILENNVIREAIINSTEAMTHIATNHESVRMIFENLEATQLLLANQDTLDLVLANTNVIRLVLTKILETHNSIFKLDINTLITNMTSMVNSTNIEYQDKIFPIVETMNTNFISIKDLLSNNNLDKNNIIAIFQCIENNLSVITALSSDEVAFNSIKEIDLAIAKTAAKLAGIDNININTSDALARSDKYMNAVASSQIAVNTIINNSGFLNIVISSSTAMSAIASSSTAMSAIASSSTAMSAIASSSTAMSAIASSSTAMLSISKSPLALNKILKTEIGRTNIANSSYLQTNYSNINTSVQNTTYFTKGANAYIDNGSRNSNESGAMVSSTTPNQCLYMSLKIGSWSNGTSTTGNIAHLQTGKIVASKTTTIGPAQSGTGVDAKYVCVGGCTFTESGDSVTYGFMAYAK